MIDISEKKDVKRYALAYGRIRLSKDTMGKIRKGEVKKGDPLVMGEIAGIMAAKNTPLLIPMCHQIPLAKISTRFELGEDFIDAFTEVHATAKTGVEMEALFGVSAALLNILDMVKYLEKDAGGQYPT
ncbi:MAG: cyclic pyranopterin monophosphate synthase MoaC, partial [Candidatus Aenigmarchaeota archaeon]|nr:cyclic pyranopterin monophosphate synthase MoaC [Candidatus Aenigmarchaeota archaeon]